MFRPLSRGLIFFTVLGFLTAGLPSVSWAALPFSTVFKGEKTFERLKRQAYRENWADLPIGKRTAAAGKAMVGIPYENYTLEIDDHIEAPSVNFEGLDCWTFFEISLAFARMLDHPREAHTPEKLLAYIELDRYRGGICDGTYLSRLHYLEDWAYDNNRRGLVRDMGKALGGTPAPIRAREMTLLWKSYRYLRNNPSLLPEMKRHEQRVEALQAYYIPNGQVSKVEAQLQDGDIIGIWSKAPYGRISTSHVGLAVRDTNGVLRFMHATTQRDLGRQVAIDSRLSTYINRYSKHRGIMVARPLK